MEQHKLEGESVVGAIKLTVTTIETIYEATAIKTIQRNIEKLLKMKQEKDKVDSVDKRSGKVRDQGKHRKKKKMDCTNKSYLM